MDVTNLKIPIHIILVSIIIVISYPIVTKSEEVNQQNIELQKEQQKDQQQNLVQQNILSSTSAAINSNSDSYSPSGRSRHDVLFGAAGQLSSSPASQSVTLTSSSSSPYSSILRNISQSFPPSFSPADQNRLITAALASGASITDIQNQLKKYSHSTSSLSPSSISFPTSSSSNSNSIHPSQTSGSFQFQEKDSPTNHNNPQIHHDDQQQQHQIEQQNIPQIIEQQKTDLNIGGDIDSDVIQEKEHQQTQVLQEQENQQIVQQKEDSSQSSDGQQVIPQQQTIQIPQVTPQKTLTPQNKQQIVQQKQKDTKSSTSSSPSSSSSPSKVNQYNKPPKGVPHPPLMQVPPFQHPRPPNFNPFLSPLFSPTPRLPFAPFPPLNPHQHMMMTSMLQHHNSHQHRHPPYRNNLIQQHLNRKREWMMRQREIRMRNMMMLNMRRRNGFPSIFGPRFRPFAPYYPPHLMQHQHNYYPHPPAPQPDPNQAGRKYPPKPREYFPKRRTSSGSSPSSESTAPQTPVVQQNIFNPFQPFASSSSGSGAPFRPPLSQNLIHNWLMIQRGINPYVQNNHLSPQFPAHPRPGNPGIFNPFAQFFPSPPFSGGGPPTVGSHYPPPPPPPSKFRQPPPPAPSSFNRGSKEPSGGLKTSASTTIASYTREPFDEKHFKNSYTHFDDDGDDEAYHSMSDDPSFKKRRLMMKRKKTNRKSISQEKKKQTSSSSSSSSFESFLPKVKNRRVKSNHFQNLESNDNEMRRKKKKNQSSSSGLSHLKNSRRKSTSTSSHEGGSLNKIILESGFSPMISKDEINRKGTSSSTPPTSLPSFLNKKNNNLNNNSGSFNRNPRGESTRAWSWSSSPPKAYNNI